MPSADRNGQQGATMRMLLRPDKYYLRPFVAAVKQRIRASRWSHHSDPRSLDWRWEAIHYNRIALVNLLLSKFDDPSYLEIGCASNGLFDSVPARDKIGVDPVSGGTVRDTSDNFFEANHAEFDVVFIDGLHTYEQCRRDVVNSLRCLKNGGWIALHDMLPRDWIEHHVPIISKGTVWTGDVWKVAFELLQTEGLEFKILKIDHGVGVVRVVDPGATLKDLRSELRDKEFSYYYDNLNKLPITEWDDAQSWLRS